MKKKLLLLVVMVSALVCLLALTSYAATITIYSGADSTTQATVHQTAQITLTGNTEANETVTVYFTDDGRAWKAGETVTFTENTNLYTIECTKLSTVSEYNNATGGGNYILMSDINNTQSGRGPINGDACTTRIFMNGKHFTIGNADGPMVQGNSHSFYLLGEGTISSAWGGPLAKGHCNKSNVDVTWLIGKDITLETNKDSGAVFTIWNTVSAKSLNIHIYGTIVKAQSGNVGVWSLLSADSISTDYNLYLHNGASVEITGCLVRYANSTASAQTGSIICDGADVILPSASYFFYDKSSSSYNGTVTVNGGTFNIANATSLAEFKAAVASDKSAQDLSATSFKVVCKECNYQLVLGEDFENLGKDFTIDSYCPNCGARVSKEVPAVFTPLGYSIRENGGYGIFYGYEINQEALAEYQAYLDANNKSATFGVFIANAGKFGTNSFVMSDGTLGAAKGIKIDMPLNYKIVNCYINGFTKDEVDLSLVMAIYTIEDGTVTYVQKEGTYAGEVTQGGVTLNVVTFRKIAELVGRTDIDIIVPVEPKDEQE